MELHQLRYFLAVAQMGSFTGAASACNVSQPTLSAQIAKLEDELGGQLIERSRHGAHLTQRGDLFRGRAADALRLLETGRFELEELSGLKRGRVTLGCLPTTGAYLLPKILKAFNVAHGHIEVSLREGSSPDLAHALTEFEVDLAITDEIGLSPGLHAETLFVEDLLVILPPDHRFSGLPSIELKSLSAEPFILMKKSHGFRTIVLDALARRGVLPRIVYESDQIDTIQALVEAGLGVSIVPRIVRREHGPRYLEILPPRPSRTIMIAYRDASTLSPAAAALKDVALTSFRV